jgi:hypothetical protein
MVDAAGARSILPVQPICSTLCCSTKCTRCAFSNQCGAWPLCHAPTTKVYNVFVYFVCANLMRERINTMSKLDPKCPKCGGQFSAGGTIRRRIPLGFGFQKSDKFQVDVIETMSYTGFCMKCGKDGEVEFSRKRKTIYPRSINAKIKAARA